MSDSKTLFIAAVVVATLAAASTDVRSRRIPNWLTVPIFVLGLLYHTLVGGLAGLGNSLAGFAVGLGLLLVPWLLGGGGAGDVKLMAAVGAWFGPKLTLFVWIASLGFALVMALAVLAYMGLTRGMSHVQKQYLGQNEGTPAVPRVATRKRVVPYAVPVALGSWMVLAYMAWH